jgi:hypothetical protein
MWKIRFSSAIALILICAMLSSASAPAASLDQTRTAKSATLALKTGSPWLLTPDGSRLIDESNFEVVPVVRDGRTLLPIASIVGELGGVALWDAAEQKITIALNEIRIELWLDRTTASVNGETRSLDVPPTAIRGRTMVPVRFVAENLGADVLWVGKSQLILIYYGGAAHKETDWEDFGRRMSELPTPEKPSGRSSSGSGEARDYWGIPIKVGDRVSISIFMGTVREIRGSQVLLYWDWTTLEDESDEAIALYRSLGIRWKEEQWMEAGELFVEEWAK